MEPWFRDNLEKQYSIVQASLVSQIPLPDVGEHPGNLFVSSSPLGNNKVFGKVLKELSKFETRSLFRVEDKKVPSSDGSPDKSLLKFLRSDDPQERSMCWKLTANCFGDVLVIGAGIGVVPALLKNNDKVTSVTVLEEEAPIAELVSKQFPGVKFITGEYFDSISQVDSKFDCIIVHPWNSFHYEMLPYKNLVASLSAEKLKDLTKGKVLVWGYSHSVDLYAEQCKKLLQKAKRNARIMQQSKEVFEQLKAKEPMTAACLGYLRELYVKNSYKRNWAPGVKSIENMARRTAMSVMPSRK